MGRGMLGEIVDDDQRVLPAVAKVLGDRDARERRDPLQSGRRSRRRHHEHAALGRAVAAHGFDHLLHGRRALADRHIDADHVRVLLVDDRVEGQGGLAGCTIADDQFPLSATHGEERVDDQHAGFDRLADQIAIDDRRRGPLDRHALHRRHRLVAIEWPA